MSVGTWTQKLDFERYIGADGNNSDTYPILVGFSLNRVPQAINGYTYYFCAKKLVKDANAAFEKSWVVPTGSIITDYALILAANEFNTEGKFAYDIREKSPTGEPKTICVGTWTNTLTANSNLSGNG